MSNSGQVLVLNQDYQPLSICSLRKSILLLFLNKAELLHKHKEKKLYTVSEAYDWPTVIRLLDYVRLPKMNIVVTRKNVIKRDGFRCQYCGKKESLTIDHVIPKSRGGSDEWDNLTTCCATCNVKKGSRTPKEANMPLLSKPHKPHHLMYLRAQVTDVLDDWKPYLYM
ncbi:HNH endonuclease [Limnoraphis robusta]|uniref:HNH endonuclease n=1 Tax=Limnoraphis robusta CCNP1315 TaxID=3110306 RepID=A0ABU5U964_9CYAN|nr:HNH endonuclease [Limnoraphis robusta]MEA5523386.1 HNH endonuclease [Limnoraphis robusta CCNP1315]